MPTRAQLEVFHAAIASWVLAEFGAQSAVRAIPDADWWRSKDGTKIDFELVSKDYLQNEFALRSAGGRVSIFPFEKEPFYPRRIDPEFRFWFSWAESWRRVRQAEFDFVSAGLTVFFGPVGEQQKTQLLRAEWDALFRPPPPTRDQDVGQPHWHFDVPVVVGDFMFRNTVDDALNSLGDSMGSFATDEELYSALDLSGVHFAMGGWDNSGAIGANWRRQTGRDCDRLQEWIHRSLLYLKHQISASGSYVKPR